MMGVVTAGASSHALTSLDSTPLLKSFKSLRSDCLARASVSYSTSTSSTSAVEGFSSFQPHSRDSRLQDRFVVGSLRKEFGSPQSVKTRARRMAVCAARSGPTSTPVAPPQVEAELDRGGAGHTLYDLLGISQDVSFREVKVAYRQLARRYHPDVCPPHEREMCVQKFLEVQEAYETLSDPDKRSVYDWELLNPGRGGMRGLAGLGMRGRAGQRGRMPRWQTAEQKEDDMRAWKPQWESQLSGLRDRASRRAAATGPGGTY